ncbi:MAG TPA: hypothetical protein VGA98_07680 [Allosphingosinicella sp.]|jgi:hypothetical protein
MKNFTWLLVGAACLGSGPAAAGDLLPDAAHAKPTVPAESFAVPNRREVEAVVLSAMAVAAAQARDARAVSPESRPTREVAATTTALRTTMIEGARREVSRRWPGTVYIPETPVGGNEFKVCLGKLGCWNVKISIHIDPA